MRDEARSRRLVAVAKAADPDPWRNQLRDTLGWTNENRERKLEILEGLAATADLDRLPEASVTRLAFALATMGAGRRRSPCSERVQTRHPDDFWVNADLGRELMFSGQPDAAVRFFAVAVGVRPQSGHALRNLGMALQRSGQLVEAADTFRRTIALRPDDGHAHVSLGTVLMMLGEHRAAEVEFREAKRPQARRLEGSRPHCQRPVGPGRLEHGHRGAARGGTLGADALVRPQGPWSHPVRRRLH